MKTTDELFKAFEGPTRMAELLGVGVSTASEMKRRKSIPVSYWPKLLNSAKGREIGLSSDDLVRLHTVDIATPQQNEAAE